MRSYGSKPETIAQPLSHVLSKSCNKWDVEFLSQKTELKNRVMHKKCHKTELSQIVTP